MIRVLCKYLCRGRIESISNGQPEIFFCDAMLGRLAKWLRLLGYDTAYERQIDDGELVTRAIAENRVLLTRDIQVMKRRQIARGQLSAYLVKSNLVQEQLNEISQRFGLKPKTVARCPEDNSSLKHLPRSEASGRVPPYVLETQREFQFCPVCRRIYWKATHWRNINKIRSRISSGTRP